VTQHPPADVQHHQAMPPNEQFECLFVALLHEARKQLRIAHSFCSLRNEDTAKTLQERF
jgi:hypothetical protein